MNCAVAWHTSRAVADVVTFSADPRKCFGEGLRADAIRGKTPVAGGRPRVGRLPPDGHQLNCCWSVQSASGGGVVLRGWIGALPFLEGFLDGTRIRHDTRQAVVPLVTRLLIDLIRLLVLLR